MLQAHATIKMFGRGFHGTVRLHDGFREWVRRAQRGCPRMYVHPRTGIERECRRWPRHTSNQGLWIRWRGDDRLMEQGVRLIDISRGGALTYTSREFPIGKQILVSSDHASRVRIKASVVGIGKAENGHQMRLKFLKPCPNSIFNRATKAEFQRNQPGRAD